MEIYLDNAATTRMSETAFSAMQPYFREVFGNPSSLHTPGQKAKEALETARAEIAECLSAEPCEIYFTSGGSEADNTALRAAAAAGKRRGKTHIISTAFEHHAVLHTLDKLKEEGFTVTLLPVHEDGLVRPEELAAALTESTCLVSVMYANNEIGTVQPIREIGTLCREKGIPFHTDAVQAVGHIPVDVRADCIDLLSLSAHKFHGPKGIGVLYAKKGITLEGLILGGAQERGKRAGTENLPAIAGMAAALREACQTLPATAKSVACLRDTLIQALSGIPHSILNGDRTHRLPGTVNFCFEGIEGESLLLLLNERGIAASSGSACTSGSLDPSHVLLALGRPHEVAHGSLRLSLSAQTTRDEVEAVKTAVPEIVSYLREISPVWEDLESGKKPHII